MPPAPEFESKAFETYLKYLRPIAGKMARKRARPHAMLGQDDLLQYALEVCMKVWQKYHGARPTAPPESFYPIAVTAMDRRLRQARSTALKFGEGEAYVVHLDAPRKDDGGRDRESWVKSVVPEALVMAPPADPVVVSRILAGARVELLYPLDGWEAAMLHELVRPSPPALAAIWRVWDSDDRREHRWSWRNVRTRGLAEALRLPLARARVVYQRVWRAIRVLPGDPAPAGDPAAYSYETELSAAGPWRLVRKSKSSRACSASSAHSRYQGSRDTPIAVVYTGEGADMFNGSAPEDPGSSAAVDASSPAKESAVPKVKKEKAPKVKKEKAPKVKKGREYGPKLENGTVVVVRGGASMRSKVPVGSKGTIKRMHEEYYYYTVTFKDGDHVLASKLVAKAS